jgi:homoserine O-acetyltransferase
MPAAATTPVAAPAPSAPAWPVVDRTVTLRDVLLDAGVVLPVVTVRYRLEGALAPARDNVALVVHALTGDVHASAWWRGVVGAGAPLDPARHAVLCANLLGGCAGTTGPTVDAPDALPPITTRDQARVLGRLLDALGIASVRLVCGGSLGGMVALEFAASHPGRFGQAVVLAAPARQTAQGIAWNAIMRRAIALGGPRDGLALARMVGMLSYRTPEGLEARFAARTDADGRFAAASWLAAHGERLVARFDAASYGALIGAMDRHDVGAERGGVARALAPIADRVTAVGIPGDLLYPGAAVEAWATEAGVRYEEIASPHGHDAFLLESPRVAQIVAAALARAEAAGTEGPAAPQTARTPSTAAPTRRASGRPTAPAVHATRRLRIALAGCGHVGGALLDLVGEGALPAGLSLSVSRVLVRRTDRDRPAWRRACARSVVRRDALVTDPEALLADDVDVLVEAIGGIPAAHALVDEALRRGIRVVTANKALLAQHGPALARRAAAHGAALDFEAAVGAAIPVVRALRQRAAGDRLGRVTAILNGTSNYVLDRVAGGTSLARAVAEAQAAGYAEADPTRDLSGEDAEDKLRVLAWLAFGAEPAALSVQRRGLDDAVAAWAAAVAREGDRVRLLASCERRGDTLVASVAPTRVPGDGAWAAVVGVGNRIELASADHHGTLVLAGPGAGGRVTAGAVLADLLQPQPPLPVALAAAAPAAPAAVTIV